MPPGKDADAIALHPNAAERYRQKVADVHTGLTKGDEASREAISLVRELIERITVAPMPPDEPPKLELVGNLAALMREPSENVVSVPMVAGARFEPTWDARVAGLFSVHTPQPLTT